MLYFDVRSPDASDSALADGLTEAIIDELGSNPRLEVVSRFAVRRYHGASLPAPAVLGRTLGAGSLVTGVLRRVGGTVQVRIELVAASTGRQLWREPYEGATQNAFQLQRDIATRVAASVGGQLTGARPPAVAAPTSDPAAYAAYLRGNGLLPLRTTRTIRAAVAAYQEAVARDPRMVSAWARLAIAHAIRLQWLDPVAARSPDSLVTAGMEAADLAIALDPRSAEAWLGRAMMLPFRNPLTYDGVEQAFERTLALAPRYAEAWQQYADQLRVFYPAGRADALRKANEYEPGRPITLLHLSNLTADSAAVALVDSAIAISPGLWSAYHRRAELNLQFRHDTAAAIRDYQTAGNLLRGEGRDAWEFDARVALARGDSVAAREIARAALARYAPIPALHLSEAGPLVNAALHWLDDREAAMSVLERVRPRGVLLAQRLRQLPELSSDPRYAALLQASSP